MRALVSLHEEVGPAATTVSAVAERAGVQRLTVYRHFPDERAMLHACTAHWRDAHPIPDPADWSGISEPEGRLRAALEAIYAYFEAGEPMIARSLRDEPDVEALAEAMVPYHTYFGEVASSLATGWGAAADRQRRLRAAVGHALRFDTWRSLRDEGLARDESVEVMTGFVRSVARED